MKYRISWLALDGESEFCYASEENLLSTVSNISGTNVRVTCLD
jgi:hypothetical protein